MKKAIISTLFLLTIFSLNIYAQKPKPPKPTPPSIYVPAPQTAFIPAPPKPHHPRPIHPAEKYGNTINLGLGIGGYSGHFRYVGHPVPVFNINYEINVASNFTLAPSVSFYTYANNYYWGNNNHPYQYYTYRETVIPVGAKATYYFDQILRANPKWDFYLAGSLGFAIVTSSWENGYYGDKNYYQPANPLFFNLHIGTEYHINSIIGATLDLSSSVSTIGLAFHPFSK